MFDKLKFAFARFMQGRYGADKFSRFLVWAALVLYVLSLIPYCWWLSYVGLGLVVYGLVRIFSRNAAARAAENAWYEKRTRALRTAVSQARVRFQNRRQYKYLRCPKCRARLKVRRGVGEGTLTCGNCKHAFKVRA